jgi:uncharacterized membrane protein YecN with MAPEG domain
LQLAIRVQANFVEYVPLALLLLIGVDALQWPTWVVHALAIVFIFARVIHTIGLSMNKMVNFGRVVGMVLSCATIAIEAVLILIRVVAV